MLPQQAQPPPNELLQWATVIIPVLIVLAQAFAPKLAQWRRSRAADKQEEYKANQEMRRVTDMQNAGWEKLHLIQEDMINRLSQENANLKLEIRSLRDSPPSGRKE